ncbi:MAG: STAS domain-containing protein, partial [Pirellulales bacterium]|nr:STAS domain-containing protein [Pirellulales bacterium]
VVAVAGALQVLAAALRLGQWFRAVSPAVIHGMLSGIGILIFASQFHVMVDDRPRESGWENLFTLPSALQKGLPLPAPESAASRQSRTAQLRQVGRLHELQEEIRELVAESVKRQAAPDERRTEAEWIRALVPRQQAVLAELDVVVGECRARTGRQRDQQACRAGEEALVQMRAALVDLDRGVVEHALQSQAIASAALRTILDTLKNHDWAAKIGVLTILVLVAWQFLPWQPLRRVPAPLAAVIVATAAAGVFSLPVLYVEVPDRLSEGVHFPSLTALSDVPLRALLQAAMFVAVIATAETLLCATAVDQMHAGPRTRYERELFAQGVGNAICGLLGALPMTGVIVRSAANVQAGGQTRWSAWLHGVWLLVFVVALGTFLRMIPTSCLAAILVYTGLKLINLAIIGRLAEFGRGEVVVYLITVGTIVGVDLLTGVIVGVVVSALKLLWVFTRLKARLETRAGGGVSRLRLEGAATFVRLPLLAAELERVGPGDELHIDLAGLDYIDHACLDLLRNWSRRHEATGGKLIIDWDSLVAKYAAADDATDVNRPGLPDASAASAH